MTGKKRSDKETPGNTGSGIPEESGDKRPQAIIGTDHIDSAFCPLCLRQISEFRPGGKKYFDSVERKENHPFGMQRDTHGRNSFKGWRYINPEDNPDLFEEVKKNFLLAIREWVVEKKWVTVEDVKKSLK
jgi:hypothetical protein